MVDREVLSFLDGYMYRVLLDMLRSAGAEESGLYDFYKARLELERHALTGYDCFLLEYLVAHFDRGSRSVVHAGIGVGTLTTALAVAGFGVTGLERDRKRYLAASRVRAAVCYIWSDVAGRYRLIEGTFPAAVLDTPSVSENSILVFTNCGADWSSSFTNSIIDLFSRFGDVLLDTRLFGTVRNAPEERDALIDAIRQRGLTVTALPETQQLGAYYHHIKRGSTVG